MPNRNKDKGDEWERKAVAHLESTYPELISETYRSRGRLLSAGQRADKGDIIEFVDVAIQVKALNDPGAGARAAAVGAQEQMRNRGVEFQLGMTPIKRARAGSVSWLASAMQWPDEFTYEPISFSLFSKALAWMRDDEGPYGYEARPRRHRIAVIQNGNAATPYFVAPLEAWIESYRPLSFAVKNPDRMRWIEEHKEDR